MKQILLPLACLLLAYATISAQNIVTSEPSKLLATHLQEVNPNWQTQTPSTLSNNNFTITNPTHQIQLHFEQVYQLLKSKSTHHLSEKQKENRLHYLEILRTYGQKGVFPKNTNHKERRPYFVDREGTRCAVAHLVDESGEMDLLKKISAENNYEYISELTTLYPDLGQWATENGFTREELMLIQPAYSTWDQYIYPIGNGGRCNGKINVMKTSAGGGVLYFAGDFTEIDGVQANSIVSWNGTNWSPIGEGVDGEIFDIHIHNGLLHIAGHFKLHGETNYANIAYYSGAEWVAMQTGDSGAIYDMETFQQKLYIGGAFTTLDGQPKSYLAFYDSDSLAWLNHGLAFTNGQVYSVPHVFAVDDTVRCLSLYENVLLVGGDFKSVAPDVMDINIIPQDAQHMGRWFGYLWLEDFGLYYPPLGPDQEIATVRIMEVVNDSIIWIVGEVESGSLYFIQYQENFFFHYGGPGRLDTDDPSWIYGFFRHTDWYYNYGNVEPSMTQGNGGVDRMSGPHGHGKFNKKVTAAAVYQGNIYFAGTFTEAFGEPLNGLAYSAWDQLPVSNQEVSVNSTINIYNQGNPIFLETPDFPTTCALNLYSINGQLLKSTTIEQGRPLTEVEVSGWSTGIYVYQLLMEERVDGGTFLFK